MKNNILLLLFIISVNVCFAQSGWVFIGGDSITKSWVFGGYNSMAYGKELSPSQNKGVYVAANFKDTGNNYYLGFWDRATSIWNHEGNITSDACTTDVYVDETEVYTNGYQLNKIITGNQNSYFIGDKHSHSTSNEWSNFGWDTMAIDSPIIKITSSSFMFGLYKWSSSTDDFFQYSLSSGWKNISTDNKGNNIYSLIDKNLLPSAQIVYNTATLKFDTIQVTQYNYSEPCIHSDPFGKLVVAIGLDTTNINDTKSGRLVYVFEYNNDIWSQQGNPLSIALGGDVNTIATSSGDIYLGGDFQDSLGNYFVAALFTNNNWGSYCGFHPNNQVLSLVCQPFPYNNSVYAAGDFTSPSGQNFIAKLDLGSWSILGNTVFSCTNNTGIEALAAGDEYEDDIYAGGSFIDSMGYHFLTHYSPTNCGTIKLTATDTIISKGTSVTFTAYTFNAGSNATYKWFKNGILLSNQTKVSYTDSALKNGDKILCKVIGNSDCSTGPLYDSINIHVTLPVTLASFNAIIMDKSIKSNWQTTSELNTNHFIIQHSTDGISFTDIGTVKAKGSGANSYAFIDNNPANGVNYYSLQSVDKDGSSSYSKVVSVNFGDNQSFSIVPNPAKDFATISFSKTVDKATIEVYDIAGKQIITQSLNGNTNTYKLKTQSLKSGLYVIKVNTETGNYNEKLLINK